ncbi:acyltransferase [Thermoproteota archaeon]
MSSVYINSTAIIDEGVYLGSGTKVWHFVHIMKDAKIGKDCIIADYVYIGKGVTIGNTVKLENRATIYEGVTIEDNVFIGPHVTFTNDLQPRSFNKDWEIIPTLVKEGSSIGARTVIVCGITIGEYSLVGAGSVVTKNIPAYALAYGNPARIRGFICRCTRKLQTEKEEKNHVIMMCPVCKEKYKIANKDYVKIERKK